MVHIYTYSTLSISIVNSLSTGDAAHLNAEGRFLVSRFTSATHKTKAFFGIVSYTTHGSSHTFILTLYGTQQDHYITCFSKVPKRTS